MKTTIKGNGLLGRPITAHDIDYIVVFDDNEQPVIAIEAVGHGVIRLSRVGEKNFPETLVRLGISQLPPSSQVIQ
jgi:hypothetical protein